MDSIFRVNVTEHTKQAISSPRLNVSLQLDVCMQTDSLCVKVFLLSWHSAAWHVAIFRKIPILSISFRPPADMNGINPLKIEFFHNFI
jgi:hypothetical protein